MGNRHCDRIARGYQRIGYATFAGGVPTEMALVTEISLETLKAVQHQHHEHVMQKWQLFSSVNSISAAINVVLLLCVMAAQKGNGRRHILPPHCKLP